MLPGSTAVTSGPTAATIPVMHCAASLTGTISPDAVSVSSSVLDHEVVVERLERDVETGEADRAWRKGTSTSHPAYRPSSRGLGTGPWTWLEGTGAQGWAQGMGPGTGSETPRGDDALEEPLASAGPRGDEKTFRRAPARG